MEGVMIGGNIRCFLKLAGTDFQPDFRGKNPAPRSDGRRRSADGYVSVPAENDACL